MRTVMAKIWNRCIRVATSSCFAVALCAILTATVAFLLYAFENRDGTGEPFAWFDGASAWPSIAIYLFATFLAIHFIIKTNFDLKQNAGELTKEFKLELTRAYESESPAPEQTSFFGWGAPPSRCVTIRARGISLARQTRKARPARKEEKLDVVTLWQRYLCRGRLWMRLGRAAPMTLLYITALGFILSLIGTFPPPSIRGNFSFPCLILPALFAFLLLSFVVIDAILLHEGFLKQLTSKRSHWPDATFEKDRYPFKPKRPSNEDELADFWDILLIAKRTEAVGNQIYYPFVILSLLIVARLSYFDNWNWPPILLVALSIHFAVALFAAWRLPREARKYRDKVLARLKRRRRQELMVKQRTPEATDTIIEEIQSTHQGAFAYLWEQPVFRALLLPSSGILATLIQYLHH
jgi:hypothetical protein